MYLCISLYNKTHAFVKIIKNIYIYTYIYIGLWGSIVSLITGLDDQGNETLLFSKPSRPALEHIVPPIQ